MTRNHVLYDLEFPDGSITKNKKMREVSMEILNYLLKEEKPLANIKEILPDSDWLLTEEEYLDKSNKSGDKRFTKRYNKISRNYYLSNQWTKDKFLNFINMLNQQFPEFKLTSLSGE